MISQFSSVSDISSFVVLKNMNKVLEQNDRVIGAPRDAASCGGSFLVVGRRWNDEELNGLCKVCGQLERYHSRSPFVPTWLCFK